jgi:hypothetical protein
MQALGQAAMAGETVTIKVYQADSMRTIEYRGRIREVRGTSDMYSDEVEMVFIPEEASVQPDESVARGVTPTHVMYDEFNNEEQSNMITHIDYDRRRRMVHISVETSSGSNIFLDSEHNEVERKIGEEMPIYLSVPEEIWTAFRNNEQRVI